MARLNDTEALVAMGTGHDACNGLSAVAGANPNAGAACTRSEGYLPPMRNPNAGIECLRSAVMKLNNGQTGKCRR
jgi:hypothetical protein